jgi:hypothetical protein
VIGYLAMNLLNAAGGTVQADVSGQTLALNGAGAITNQGRFRAMNGGVLSQLSPISQPGCSRAAVTKSGLAAPSVSMPPTSGPMRRRSSLMESGQPSQGFNPRWQFLHGPHS